MHATKAGLIVAIFEDEGLNGWRQPGYTSMTATRSWALRPARAITGAAGVKMISAVPRIYVPPNELGMRAWPSRAVNDSRCPFRWVSAHRRSGRGGR